MPTSSTPNETPWLLPPARRLQLLGLLASEPQGTSKLLNEKFVDQDRDDTTTRPHARIETLEGWGMRDQAKCRVVCPNDTQQLAGIFAEVAASGGSLGMRG